MVEKPRFEKNNLTRREDILSPFLKKIFDDDFFPILNNIHSSMMPDLKETEKIDIH